MWKAGQLVTINNVVYRVTKADPYKYGTHDGYICRECKNENHPFMEPCYRGVLPQGYCIFVVGSNNYLKRLLPCGSRDK